MKFLLGRPQNRIFLQLLSPLYPSWLTILYKRRCSALAQAMVTELHFYFPELLPPANICGIILAWTVLSEFRISSSILEWSNKALDSIFMETTGLVTIVTDGTLRSHPVILQTPTTGYKEEKHKNNWKKKKNKTVTTNEKLLQHIPWVTYSK